MSIKITLPGGIEVHAADAAEAARFMREMQGLPTTSKAQAPPAANGHDTEGPSIDRETAQISLAVLRAIRDTPEGIKAGTLMPLVGASSAKGIGSRSAGMNKILRELGFRQDQVYTNPRKPNEGRTWFPQRKIGAAISAIESALGH